MCGGAALVGSFSGCKIDFTINCLSSWAHLIGPSLLITRPSAQICRNPSTWQLSAAFQLGSRGALLVQQGQLSASPEWLLGYIGRQKSRKQLLPSLGVGPEWSVDELLKAKFDKACQRSALQFSVNEIRLTDKTGLMIVNKNFGPRKEAT